MTDKPTQGAKRKRKSKEFVGTAELVYPGRQLSIGDRGKYVLAVQAKVGVEPTGFFCFTTRTAVKQWQRNHSDCCGSADGIVGQRTWSCMFG